MSTAHRFQFEIVAYIFTLAFPRRDAPPRCARDLASFSNPGPIPLIFAKVCHTWRVLALSTPGSPNCTFWHGTAFYPSLRKIRLDTGCAWHWTGDAHCHKRTPPSRFVLPQHRWRLYEIIRVSLTPTVRKLRYSWTNFSPQGISNDLIWLLLNFPQN